MQNSFWKQGQVNKTIDITGREGWNPNVGFIVNGSEIKLSNENAIVENWNFPQPFAVFSMRTRTAADSLYPARPNRDFSLVQRTLDMDITKASPAQMPMEISFLPVTSANLGSGVGNMSLGGSTSPAPTIMSAPPPGMAFYTIPRFLSQGKP